MDITDILVPIDFSTNSLQALEFALSLVQQEGEVYLLHVIDIDFVTRLSEEGFSEEETAIAQLRRKAEEQLQQIIKEHTRPELNLNSIVVVGKPFAEILRVASELEFQMIVMGIHGRRKRNIEELLFGSTAEKVLRGTRIPVVCVPAST